MSQPHAHTPLREEQSMYAVKNTYNGFTMPAASKADAEREARRMNKLFNHWSQPVRMKFVVVVVG